MRFLIVSSVPRMTRHRTIATKHLALLNRALLRQAISIAHTCRNADGRGQPPCRHRN